MQERWLSDGLAGSAATWNVLAQQVVVSRLDLEPGDDELLNADSWYGYPVAQQRLHDGLADASNPVVLTGDVHASYAFDVTRRVGDPESETIGVELATTSISSGGDGADITATSQQFLDANPQLRHVNHRRGYTRCRLTPSELTVEFRTVPYVERDARAPITTTRSFVVTAGAPGLMVQ